MSNDIKSRLDELLSECPIVGIFRGIDPDQVIEIADAAWRAGIRVIEVPMNSPEPFKSIAKLRNHFDERMIIGGGTITNIKQVHELANSGGEISVSPNCDADVIKASIQSNIIPMPGIATATEAFTAIDAGAEHLKLFPASYGGLTIVRALRDVLPKHISILAVGGVSTDNAKQFMSAGFNALGIGSGVYRQGRSAHDVFEASRQFVNSVKS